MLARGERLTEILKQDQYQPLPMEKQVVIIFAATNGFLDAYPVAEGRRYERELYRFLDTPPRARCSRRWRRRRT